MGYRKTPRIPKPPKVKGGKKQALMSREQFIEGATQDPPPEKKSRKKVSMENVLLSANGKLGNRRAYSRVVLYVMPDIDDDMDKYCSGTKQAILTYLIRRGIEDLKKNNKLEIFEIS